MTDSEQIFAKIYFRKLRLPNILQTFNFVNLLFYKFSQRFIFGKTVQIRY